MNFTIAGAVFAFLGVALGAFGAHALKGKLSEEYLAVFQTGVQYEMYHSLGLIAIGILQHFSVGGQTLLLAGWFLFAGIVLFSGSLYALTLLGKRKLGAITPLGGLCFLAGWLLLIISVA